MRPIARVMLVSALAVFAVVGLYCGIVLAIQRSFVFPVRNVGMAPLLPATASQVWLPIAGGQVEAWYLPSRGSQGGAAPLILFTHGNGEVIDFLPREFDEPRRWGMGVLLVEYPGYGRSKGSPSESSITDAVLAAYDWAIANPEVDRSRIVAYGRSLGGGAACDLAIRRPVSALVLESTFTSVRSFAHQFWAPEALILDPFDNVAALGKYSGPVLILHGDHDDIVSTDQGRTLAAGKAGAELTLMPCAHNDCERPWAKIHDFLGRQWNGAHTHERENLLPRDPGR